tara:strand:- start:1437 stop:1661 length:225 start_codon:yes stop_codon:yes gene_type:complete
MAVYALILGLILICYICIRLAVKSAKSIGSSGEREKNALVSLDALRKFGEVARRPLKKGQDLIRSMRRRAGPEL